MAGPARRRIDLRLDRMGKTISPWVHQRLDAVPSCMAIRTEPFPVAGVAGVPVTFCLQAMKFFPFFAQVGFGPDRIHIEMAHGAAAWGAADPGSGFDVAVMADRFARKKGAFRSGEGLLEVPILDLREPVAVQARKALLVEGLGVDFVGEGTGRRPVLIPLAPGKKSENENEREYDGSPFHK